MHLADVKQWMLMRRALEMEVVASCAARLSEDGLGKLGQNLAYQRAALASGDLQGFHDLDTRFHRLMVEGLALTRIGEVLDPIRTHLERVRLTLLPEPGRARETFGEHESIYQAVAARDADRARRGMAKHLDRVACELEAFVARHPDFFEP
jgi:DNA-binding GntR family transcriptional regulator